MTNITTLNRIFRRDHQYEKFSSWVGFLIFLNNSFLHPKGNAHTAVTRNVAKFVNFPLLSCVVDQVTWFKILNAVKNVVIWIPIVTALQISCSWQPPLCFTAPRCCSRWCKIWVFSTFVNGNTYQLRDWAIWEQKTFFLQSCFILRTVFAIPQFLIWIPSLSKNWSCWKFLINSNICLFGAKTIIS